MYKTSGGPGISILGGHGAAGENFFSFFSNTTVYRFNQFAVLPNVSYLIYSLYWASSVCHFLEVRHDLFISDCVC
jgi:hypothetical protein